MKILRITQRHHTSYKMRSKVLQPEYSICYVSNDIYMNAWDMNKLKRAAKRLKSQKTADAFYDVDPSIGFKDSSLEDLERWMVDLFVAFFSLS